MIRSKEDWTEEKETFWKDFNAAHNTMVTDIHVYYTIHVSHVNLADIYV